MNIHRTNDLLRTAEQNVKNEERFEEWNKVRYIKKENGQSESLGDYEKKLKKTSEKTYRRIRHYCEKPLDIRGMI